MLMVNVFTDAIEEIGGIFIENDDVGLPGEM